MTRKLPVLLFALFSLSTIAQAQDIIFQNPITGSNPSLDNPYITGNITAENVTASGIGRGPGLNYFESSTPNTYQANGYNTPTMDPTAYFEFTITPAEGYAINYSTLQFTSTYSGAPSITPFVIRSSMDNYTANILFTQANAVSPCNVSLVQFNEVEEAVTFRIFPYGSANPTDYFGLNTFTFRGTVTATMNTPNHSKQNFKAYPNPAKNILTLSASQEIQAATVYNATGSIVLQEDLNATESTINLSSLQAGIYFVQIQTATGSKTLKVVKQ